jgi:hypothetical protein
MAGRSCPSYQTRAAEPARCARVVSAGGVEQCEQRCLTEARLPAARWPGKGTHAIRNRSIHHYRRRRYFRRELDRLASAVRAGQSRALVVRGEPGIGKTALLDYLAAHAPGCRVERTTGIQSELELAFAGLHQLCQHAHGPVPPAQGLRQARDHGPQSARPRPSRRARGRLTGAVAGPCPGGRLRMGWLASLARSGPGSYRNAAPVWYHKYVPPGRRIRRGHQCQRGSIAPVPPHSAG